MGTREGAPCEKEGGRTGEKEGGRPFAAVERTTRELCEDGGQLDTDSGASERRGRCYTDSSHASEQIQVMKTDSGCAPRQDTAKRREPEGGREGGTHLVR